MVTISLPASELLPALAKVTPFTSEDDARPVLQTVFVELGVEPGLLTLTTADGFRLGHVALPYKASEGASFMLPLEAWKALLKVKHNKRTDPEIRIEVHKYAGLIRVDGKILVEYDHIGGQYPDYRQIIPRSHKTTLAPDMTGFEQAVKTARVFAREGSMVARLHITDGLIVESSSEETGQSINQVPAVIDGPALLIAFNCDFLVDLAKITRGEPVTFYFSRANAPARFEACNFTGVIMPMHIDGGGQIPHGT